MSTDDYVLSYDTRPITVGTLVQTRAGGHAWQVQDIHLDNTGRAWLSVVDPDNPNRHDAFYADLTIVVDDN